MLSSAILNVFIYSLNEMCNTFLMKTLKLVCLKSGLFIRSLKPAIFDLFPSFVLDKFCRFCFEILPPFHTIVILVQDLCFIHLMTAIAFLISLVTSTQNSLSSTSFLMLPLPIYVR